MSDPRLPQETIDHILDILHDKPETLKACCLVSKSWIPRTRKYLFGDIKFFSVDHLELWKKSFPDPANSPAIHTHTLTICCTHAVLAAAIHVPRPPRNGLTISYLGWGSGDTRSRSDPATFGYLGNSLPQLYGFSPTLRSLCVNSLILPCPEFFDLVLSFPFLEDLALSSDGKSGGGDSPRVSQNANPSTSPPLRGTLDLFIPGEMENTARWLLNLPGGLHFRSLVFNFSWYHGGDLQWMSELVAVCSGTLKWINITEDTGFCQSETVTAPINLSTATKLVQVSFRAGPSLRVDWMSVALRTITPKNQDLRRIYIFVPHYLVAVGSGADIREAIGDPLGGYWSELDRVLIQLSESHSIRPKVFCAPPNEEGLGSCTPAVIRAYVACLLPKAAKGGVIDVVVRFGPCRYVS